MDYEIFVESMDGSERLGQLPFESLTLTMRFNAAGKYEIKLPTAMTDFDFVNQAYRLVITRDNSVLFCGPVGKMTRNWQDSKDELSLAGFDDLQFLAGRVALPVPGGPPYTSADHDVRIGPIETLLYDYVKYNAGSSATGARQVAGLTLGADQGRGITITARARFAPLISLLSKIANLDNFGFRVRGMEFQVYRPEDKTNLVVFSNEMNNLISFKHEYSGPTANYVYAGGGGEGTNRVIEEGYNEDSVLRFWRAEAFRDQRNTSDTGELQQSITDELLRQADKTAIKFTANTTLDEVGLGDLVSVVFDNTVYQQVIREITIKTDGVTEDVDVMAGSPGISSQLEIYSKLDDLREAMIILEVR